jgi:16S rRNA (guanine527-N7)-methyltransferase
MENVSRETQTKFDHYALLLRKWQRAINLVSKSTLDDIENRHIADSQQLAIYIDKQARVYDLGSGAGFPGLVLAMLRPDLDVHLIESDQRKCQFLRTVSRETNTDICIHNKRIEALDLPAPDIVTARAFASLSEILAYVRDWARASPGLKLVLLKGAYVAEEIEAAKDIYNFMAELTPSQTGDGYIVAIRDIKA